MVLIGIVGEMRSGKTLLMSILLYKEHLKGRKVLSNYRLAFPHEPLDLNDLDLAIRGKNTDRFENAVLGLDEFHLAMDSRSSGQKRNKMISFLILQSGKLRSSWYYSTQFLRQIDVRVRLNTQILYKVRRFIMVGKKRRYLRQDDKREDFHILVEKFVMSDKGGELGFYPHSHFYIRNPRAFFGIYDTLERVYYQDQVSDKKEKDGAL